VRLWLSRSFGKNPENILGNHEFAADCVCSHRGRKT
jgi:hypothetical protein